jgi:hypothetical protein
LQTTRALEGQKGTSPAISLYEVKKFAYPVLSRTIALPNLWKDPDTDIPILRQARAENAKHLPERGFKTIQNLLIAP